MKREIFADIVQGSPEWRAKRLGRVTASEFATTISSTFGKEKTTKNTYMLTLVGERITGEVSEKYVNKHMDRGHMLEEQARDFYSLLNNTEVAQVGIITLGDEIGYSPDGLIGSAGLWEAKSREPHILLELHKTQRIPKKDYIQCQGGLWVSDREWIDYMAYWPGMKPFIRRLHRDKKCLIEIRSGVDEFLAELHETMEWYAKLEV